MSSSVHLNNNNDDDDDIWLLNVWKWFKQDHLRKQIINIIMMMMMMWRVPHSREWILSFHGCLHTRGITAFRYVPFMNYLCDKAFVVLCNTYYVPGSELWLSTVLSCRLVYERCHAIILWVYTDVLPSSETLLLIIFARHIFKGDQ